MRFSPSVTRFICVLALTVLAGCGGSFRTYYDQPATQSADWRLSSVQVTVPRTLAVSEAEVYLPKADIVWREDPRGDRYVQVEKIMRDAITKGAAGLHGSRPVILKAVMTRFHAMTFTAETKAPGGTHDIEFNLTISDAATGATLYGPTHVEASFPAMTGEQMARARVAGQSQKSQISAHVAATIRGLLGLGPDARATFNSIGG